MSELKSLGVILAERFTEAAIKSRPDRMKTGFPQLDQLLGGGLSPGLTVLGGSPGLGKSTFALQLAGHVAESGTPALYFSLEMSSDRLAAKTLSRKIFQAHPVLAPAELRAWGVTAGQLTSGEAGRALAPDQWQRIHQARSDLRDVERLYVIDESLSAREIASRVNAFLEESPGPKPLVIVDYLQILPPDGLKARNEKQLVEDSLKYMTDLARGGVTVLLISSLNRSGYQGSMRLDAFKETGGIEYSADTLLGLQFFTGGEKIDVNAEKCRFPRDVEIVVLKQRYGGSGTSVRFDYYAEFDCFREAPPGRPPAPLPQAEPVSAAGQEPAPEPSAPRAQYQQAFYMNNTKLANEIRNGRYTPGELRPCSVFRDGSVETSFTLSQSLSRFDFCAADAVYTLYKSGETSFTARQVLWAMSGAALQNVGKEKQIQESLDRLCGADIAIRCTEEMRKRKKLGPDEEKIISGPFLAVRREKNRYRFLGFDVSAVLPLYAYGELTRQMVAFPVCLLAVQTDEGVQMKNTTENIYIKRFLIRRLEVLRNRNNQSATNMRTISLQETGELMTEIGMGEHQYKSASARQHKLRCVCQSVESVLRYYQQIGYLSHYESGPAAVHIKGDIRDPWTLNGPREPEHT